LGGIEEVRSREVKAWIAGLLRLLVAATFLYAGIIKVISPIRFSTDINNYHVLPWSLTVALAFYLPWLEIICGLALLLRRFYYGAITILLALTAVFIIASVSAKLRGIDVICGCFGRPGRNLNFAAHLAIDAVLLAAIGVLWLIDYRIRLERA
jgi:putative oxidoreductase